MSLLVTCGTQYDSCVTPLNLKTCWELIQSLIRVFILSVIYSTDDHLVIS